MPESFVSLRNYSFYSILSALSSPKDILNHAKTLGHSAVALTDFSHGYGLIDFTLNAKKIEGIKPLLGAEITVTMGSRVSAHNEAQTSGTLLFLAANNEGYDNLLALLSLASLEGSHDGVPKVDFTDLEKHNVGLTVLFGSPDGLLFRYFGQHGAEKTIALAEKLKNMFKSGVYAEFIAKETDADRESNEFQQILTEKGYECVVTCGSRYLKAEDEEPTEVLSCISSGGLILNPNRSRPTQKSHFKDWEEAKMTLNYVPSQLLEQGRANTVKIAEAITTKLEFDQSLLPVFDVPEGETEASYLKKRCEDAILVHYAGVTPEKQKEVQERLDYELSIISKMGFDAYFLIVEDLIKYAKDRGIAVGPGRGSAAGSIVSYLLDITTIDPIEYELLFERFLNPARISMPDIDIDFSDERREEVQRYVTEKYGENQVAKVCTFGTLSAKAALKDVGRAYGVPFSEMNALTKALPAKPGFALKDAEEIPDFTDKIAQSTDLQKVFSIAKRVEGCIRHVSVHACAVIIAKDPLVGSTPLQWSPTDSTLKITQYPYQQLEKIGLLKMDFLGLRNLSVLERTLKLIKNIYGKDIDLKTIPLDDKKTFEMISRGETTGVFQFESAGMRRYLKELKPTEFEDLVAMSALYRPGPMEFIPQYIQGKHDPTTVKYFHPDLEPLLKKTYGIAVYQEQILKIAQTFAGFSLGEADLLRKAIGKKIHEVLMEQRKKFVAGAQEKGHTESLAIKMFDDVIVPFAGYGFNRSHAVCYSRIAYETAYLRANYPIAFMTALMTTDRNNIERVVLEMREAEQMGIEVLPPDVNASFSDFTIVPLSEVPKKKKNGIIKKVVVKNEFKHAIRFGLTAIKGLGEDTVKEMTSERENGGKFTSITDVADRVPAKFLNKKSLEALAFSGALDAFADRAAVVQGIDSITSYAKSVQKKQNTGQMGLFGEVMAEDSAFSLQLPKVHATREEIMAWEKQSLGLYVSDHPLKPWEDVLEKTGTPLSAINDELDGKTEKFCGMIASLRKIITRKGDQMAIIRLEDFTGDAEMAIFPRTFAKLPPELFALEKVVEIQAKVRVQDGQLRISVENIKPLAKSEEKKAEHAPKTIVLPDNMPKSAVQAFKLLLKQYQNGKGDHVRVKVQGKTVDLPFKVQIEGAFMEALKEFGGIKVL